ncbi:MAG: alpha-L-fucosidase [Candidatus Symbiothrix sp.]|nr:alpha-L-fucosidase [Candidatus Symbiothrix sp.]
MSVEFPSHPRLLLFDEDKDALLEQIRMDEKWKMLHEDILSESEKIIDLPLLERKQIGMRLLAVSREAQRRIFFLSYSYRMTNDDKYFVRAEQELLRVCGFTDWNPNHFLDVAEMTLGLAIGYDWLYEKLSIESKKIISYAIVEKGIKPSENNKYGWWLDAKHNWNQVCNAGMLFGALAVYDENPSYSQNIIQRCIHSIKLPMKDYGPDGAYPEGYTYWEYGTTFNVLLLSALEKIYGADFGLLEIDGFMNTASYYEHMTGLHGDSFNFGDCGDEYGLTPAMFWFARQKDDSSLLWVEKSFLDEKYRDNYLKNRILPAVMVWGIGIDTEKIVPPAELMWSGNGTTPVALMRTSWTDSNGIYVGFKGGTAGSNHSHMDAGSFVMEADGVRWAMDFGKQDYQSLESRKLQIWTNDQNSERWKVFRYNNFVHNTLTVNNKLHNVEGYASILQHTEEENFMSAITDMTSIFEGELASAKRGIAIVDKKYVMLRDEIETLADKPAVIRWNMLTSAEVKMVGENKIELYKDGKKLRLEIISNQKIELKTWSTQSPNDYDAPNPGAVLVGFESDVPVGEKADFTVFLLPEKTKFRKKDLVELNQWINPKHQYQANWESLDARPMPEWFQNAKFGIFIHWGLYSVPSWAPNTGDVYSRYAEWYWHRINPEDKDGEAFRKYHDEMYGPKFNYQDFVGGFKAEMFNPDQWVDVIKSSGAKYVVLTSKHHEGFALWQSAQSVNWNSVDVGPHRDICGELTDAVRKQGLHMGFYFSLYEWEHPLYKQNVAQYVDEHMIPQLKDLTLRYQPEVIWSDGEWEHSSKTWKSEEFLAWLYNESPVRETVVVNDRWGEETRSKHGSFYTTEYDLIHESDSKDVEFSHPWEECRGIAGSFGYNRNENLEDYSTAKELVHILIEKVSRGGNLLLNVGPTADGRIPVIMQQRLSEMGEWLDVNGEAIYDTRQWNGKSDSNKQSDIYFTAKGKDVYVIVTEWKNKPITIHNIGNIKNISLLGSGKKINYSAKNGSVTINPPALEFSDAPCRYAWVYKLSNALEK